MKKTQKKKGPVENIWSEMTGTIEWEQQVDSWWEIYVNDSLYNEDQGDTLSQSEKDKIGIVYIIRNGSVEIAKKEELDKKNYFYRLHSRVDWVMIIDYDKTSTVPILKDILNRQHTFIEIKKLNTLIIMMIFSLLLTFIFCMVAYIWRPNFDPVKTEILAEIKKIPSLINIQIAQSKRLQDTSTNTTSWSWYSPIPMSNSIENNKKNIQKYAN